jgi:cellulose synthase/poly-beta-1,6-N-acetylglucosamine synthase-like glycosyltransferase
MISIVIPAHNEASVIGRCLEAMTRGNAQASSRSWSCNGCKDDTAAVGAPSAARA